MGQAPPKTHRGRWIAAACAVVGVVFLGRKYLGQSPPEEDGKPASFLDAIVQKNTEEAAVPRCRDSDWVDSHNDACDWYNSDDRCGIADQYATPDTVATRECCRCGGGCTDTAGFVDSHNDHCDWYNSDERCGLASDYTNGAGAAASDSCCSCGGGTRQR